MNKLPFRYRKLDATPIIPFLKQTIDDHCERRVSYGNMGPNGNIDPDTCQALIGMSSRAYYRVLKDEIITLETADNACCALGLHLDLIWDSLYLEDMGL